MDHTKQVGWGMVGVGVGGLAGVGAGAVCGVIGGAGTATTIAGNLAGGLVGGQVGSAIGGIAGSGAAMIGGLGGGIFGGYGGGWAAAGFPSMSLYNTGGHCIYSINSGGSVWQRMFPTVLGRASGSTIWMNGLPPKGATGFFTSGCSPSWWGAGNPTLTLPIVNTARAAASGAGPYGSCFTTAFWQYVSGAAGPCYVNLAAPLIPVGASGCCGPCCPAVQ